MATSPRLRILSVGGNAVSAFLSWRLQATQACDVTLVWKNGFESVSQYGISFKSSEFGNERFKPHAVVRAPEDATNGPGGFDYVLLSIKALPDVYDIAGVIESVVSPEQTCILVNTTNSLGVEEYLETRFPKNVVISLVSGATVNQTASSEFEHSGPAELWVGAASRNPNIPEQTQHDMAEALAYTLESGNVQCHVSENIRQQQWERMMGPIIFHPLSVIFETPDHKELLEKTGVKRLTTAMFEELIALGTVQGCHFPSNFRERVIENMTQPNSPSSVMYQDFANRRPLEIETYLGACMKMADNAGTKVPSIAAIYPIIYSINVANQTKPPQPTQPASPAVSHQPGPPPVRNPPPRVSSMNGTPVNGRPRPPPPGQGPPGRRPGPGPMNMSNGYPPRPMNGASSPRAPPSMAGSRRNSFDNDLEEFGHIAMYGDQIGPDGIEDDSATDYNPTSRRQGPQPSITDLALREKELNLRRRELALREQEMKLRKGGPPPNGFGRRRNRRNHDIDEEDDDDYYSDPADPRLPPPPMIDADSFDMMSATQRRHNQNGRRMPSAGNLRNDILAGDAVSMRGGSYRGGPPGRPNLRNRASSRMAGAPELHNLRDQLMDDPLMGYSSNRYGHVDRKSMADTSRANSMSSTRNDDFNRSSMANGQSSSYPPNNPSYSNGPVPRRSSLAPQDAPYYGNGPTNGHMNGRIPGPSQPPIMRQPQPRYPGTNPMLSDQNGVSHPHMLKDPAKNPHRSLTGSASASAGSAESANSQLLYTEDSAHSSSSSLERRHGVPIRT